MKTAVAIDLGTTNTVVGYQDDNRGPKLLSIPQPRYERLRLEPLDHIKSAIFFETSSTAVVGAFAANRLDAFKSIKSKMGSRWRGRHPYDSSFLMPPAYIQGHILKMAAKAIRERFPSWDGALAITVPASFNTEQRHDTLNAAGLAGIGPVHLVDEPTAAFYYYLNQIRADIAAEGNKVVLIFDLGGGTLDVSITKILTGGNGVTIDTIGRSRYNNLGGDDVDMDIAAFMLGCWEYERETEVTSITPSLRKSFFKLFVEKSREYKEESEGRIAEGMDINEFAINEELRIGKEVMPVRFNRQISRAQYEEITSRYTGNKSDTNIFKPIGQALAVAAQIDPGITKDSIDLVLYTGGSSRLKSVKVALENFFAPTNCVSISDDDACNTVALGAACYFYDFLNRGNEINMTYRLLETIMTRSEDGWEYTPLVPLTCEPSSEYTKVEHVFRTTRDLIGLSMPLFRGIDRNDPHLSPMGNLELAFNRVVKEGTAYTLWYRMTRNKIVEVKIQMATENGLLEATGTVNVARAHRERTIDTPLSGVN